MRSTFSLTLATIISASVSLHAETAETVDFQKQIKPLLESACVHCHSEKSAKGELVLTTLEGAIKGGEDGTSLVPGDPDGSPLFTSTNMGAEDDDVMPPKKEGLLAKEQIELLRSWIKQGAKWPAGVKLEQKTRIDFVKHIQPILEENCLSCHNPDKAKGDLILSTKKDAFTTGENHPAIVAYDVEKSALYKSTALEADDDDLMPPKKSGGPLKKEQIAMLRGWIEQGAIWPEGVTLKAKEKAAAPSTNPDDMELVKKIHAFIVQTSKEKAEAEMKSY
ncbi:MAG: hypothetical protein RL693_229, partial [Verrucomicrobiota bacterium]